VVKRRGGRQETERLLAASGRIARLRALHDALAAAADEARQLALVEVGLCVATGTDGRWIGAIADREGTRLLSEETVTALRELAVDLDEPTGVDIASQPLETRLALPPCTSIVLAPADSDAPVPLILGVAHDHPGTAAADAELLGRFTTSAALAIGNARLFEQIESAYRQQLDLNRQKDDFVATVSHELRTPVAALRGTIDTIGRLGARLDPDKLADLVAGAAGYGDHLQRLIEELLLVAATEKEPGAITVTEVELRRLVEDVVDATAVVADGRVVPIISPVLQSIRTDLRRLRTVLVQLVENAAKFAPDGLIEVEAVAAGTRALFYVTDHGPGIAPVDRQRVFERFVQLDQSTTRARGGLGLGLYLARQLAGELGGELVVTDGPTGGACFCLAILRDLPATPPRRADRVGATNRAR
jgi:signal transduction histidine kinase